EMCPTAMGHGFAVPHCKCDAVLAPTLAVARLGAPVDWGAADREPVDTVILLAMREADAERLHMQVFAKLARRLVHEEFRARLRAAPDAASIVDLLREEVGAAPAH